jgi:hypothetical protein
MPPMNIVLIVASVNRNRANDFGDTLMHLRGTAEHLLKGRTKVTALHYNNRTI